MPNNSFTIQILKNAATVATSKSQKARQHMFQHVGGLRKLQKHERRTHLTVE